MKPHIDIFRHISDKSVKYDNYVTSRDKLPTCNGNIEWTKVIGCIFDFSYQGFDGYLTIVDYNVSISTLYFTINDSEDIYNVRTQAFKKAGFREIIKVHYYDYNVGDIVKNKEILGFTYNGKSIFYQYKCLNDGYIGNIQQSNISRNTGVCPVCLNHKVMVGVNDITTTDPWMIPYFKNGYDEAKLYVATSNIIKELQCPHCGRRKTLPISSVYKLKGFSCECSDKIPYPEKCMINLLSTLNINYNFQCGNNILSWVTDKYHYDFYIPNYNIIVETNGKQHYKELSPQSKWTSLEIIQKRDLYKRNLALSNNIKHYIELDCSESDIKQFKNSVLNSELPVILGFCENDINWNYIDQLSTRNIVKEICLFQEQYPHFTPEEIARKFHINKRILPKYYKLGEKFGWCTYNKERIRWVSHFHRNTHYCINGHYFYNRDEITTRSFDIFGENIRGSSVATYIQKSTGKRLFNNKYEIRTLTHKEYLTENTEYPPFITKEVINGLQEKYK